MDNLELDSFLRYTPFDNKFATIFGNERDTEKCFFDILFESYDDRYYKPLKQKLDDAIRSVDSRFIYFIGPAGSGKTTFLNYYFRTIPKGDNVSYSFINLVRFPSASVEEDTLRRNLCNYIDAVLDEAIIDRFIDECVDNGNYIPALFGENQRDNSCLLNFLFGKKYDDKKSAVKELMNYYGSIQLATFFIIFSIYKNEGSKKQNVFIFDNIDELSSTYIAKNFVSFILDVFSIVQEYFNKVDEKYFAIDSPFINHCTFLIAIRAINAKLIGESQQQNERVRMQNKSIEFDPHIYSYPKMLRKRIDYYTEVTPKLDETGGRFAFRKYSQIVTSEEHYVMSHVEPLLNYDRRILTLSFKNIFDKPSWFEDISALPNGIGSRGTVILNTLDFLYQENNNSSLFSNYVRNDILNDDNNDEQKCNIHRMCFTLLSNLSGLALIDKNERPNVLNDESGFFEHLKGVRLDVFVKRLKDWYSDDEIKNVLTTLVSISSSNYEVPVFLEGDVVNRFTNDYYNTDNNNHSIPSYVHALVDYVMDLSDSAKQSVFVKINPLCVVYPYHIFIHFEYYNLLSYYDPNRKSGNVVSLKPLFLISEKKELVDCLNRVWASFNKMITKMQTHFCNECKGNCPDSVVDRKKCGGHVLAFKKAQFCLNGALYSTRTISSIINYLDSFRIFMWKKANYEKDIQNIILSEMKKYLNKYWDKRIQDTSAQNKIAEISRNIREIESSGEYGRSCMFDVDDLGVN